MFAVAGVVVCRICVIAGVVCIFAVVAGVTFVSLLLLLLVLLLVLFCVNDPPTPELLNTRAFHPSFHLRFLNVHPPPDPLRLNP